MNEWRNIQDIVRLRFKAFHDVLRSQGDAIRRLEAALAEERAEKVDLAQVNQVLKSGSKVEALRRRVEDLEATVAEKAGKRDLGRELKKLQLPTKVEVQAAIDDRADVLQAQIKRLDTTDLGAGGFKKINRLLRELKEDIAARPDMEEIAMHLEAKGGVMEVGQILDEKADYALLQKKADAERVDHQLQSLRALVESELEQRPSKLELDEAVARLAREVREAHGATQSTVQDALAAKADWKATDAIREKVFDQLRTMREEVRAVASKGDAHNLNAAELLKSLGETMDASLGDLRGDLQKTHAKLQQLEDFVGDENVGTQHYFQEGLAQKVDAQQVKHLIHNQLKELRKAVDTKAEAQQVAAALKGKANVTAVKDALDKLQTAAGPLTKQDFWSLQDEMKAKAGMKDVCSLLDVKANVEDVNLALADVSKEMDGLLTREAFEQSVRKQSAINASLLAESSVGRWIWKDGKTKKGNGVPWNHQSINTDPDNFIWEKDKVSVMAVIPGLYEVTFGFFTRKKPAIQLLVNGEPVLAAINSASYVVHHSSGRLSSTGQHPAGNVTGLTLIDFLALPPRARIAVTYNGEEGGEGFLSMKKL